MEQANMNSANNEVVQQMERLSINKVQTPETALGLASFHISNHSLPTDFTDTSGSRTQAPCTQSSPIRPSSSITDLTTDMAHTASSRSPVNLNVTETSTRHWQVPTHPELDVEARFYCHKYYLEACLHQREALVHLEARKDAIERVERDITRARLEYFEAIRELAKRDLPRARLEYFEALRELRQATGEDTTTNVGEVPGLMMEEAALEDVSDDTMMEE